MKYVRVIMILVMALECWGAQAQFSISRVKPSSLELIDFSDSIKLNTIYTNDFFNRSLWQAQRREMRKQRNTTEFSATLQMAQTQFENWASGGDNTFSGRSTLFFRHQHKRRKFSTDTKIEARYGLNYIEGKRFKNEDEFKMNFLSSWAMHDRWSYAASANLRSQFSTSYKSRTDNTRKSTFMAPGFLDVSIGFKYAKKPFAFIVSPIGGNAVFVMDDKLKALGMNGVRKGRSSKWKMGPSFRAEVDMEFVKKVFRLRSYLDTFTNFKITPTMRWETTLDIRATKFLTTTIYGLVYYDKEAIIPKPDALQYKYSLSVGLSYTFKNK